MAEQSDPPKAKRGFAAMSPERRRAIAAKGGSSVPAEKRSFSQSRDLAASAGRVGGSSGRMRNVTPSDSTGETPR